MTEERVDFSKPKVSTTWLTEDVTRDQIDHSLNVVLARLTGQQQSRPEVDEPETVTITISRRDAEHYARPAAILEELQPYLIRLNEACRTALEAERG